MVDVHYHLLNRQMFQYHGVSLHKHSLTIDKYMHYYNGTKNGYYTVYYSECIVCTSTNNTYYWLNTVGYQNVHEIDLQSY